MTATHELGHVMDHLLKVHLIGPAHVTTEQGLYASEALHSALHPWWTAVQSTAVYQILHATQRNRVRFGEVSRGLTLDSPAECFACSFAQLVATDTQNPTFLAELQILQKARSPRYWSDAEFVPVGDAMRALFTRLGW
ncbi:hypothetical protein [Deinococcus multiflagellatus]|uniref:Uncharacterized protein n=2 Tax=Deinococcus multiflagellatus TaxID=1656887 RepID=A0ABW1ZNR0_9DEIO